MKNLPDGTNPLEHHPELSHLAKVLEDESTLLDEEMAEYAIAFHQHEAAKGNQKILLMTYHDIIRQNAARQESHRVENDVYKEKIMQIELNNSKRVAAARRAAISVRESASSTAGARLKAISDEIRRAKQGLENLKKTNCKRRAEIDLESKHQAQALYERQKRMTLALATSLKSHLEKEMKRQKELNRIYLHGSIKSHSDVLNGVHSSHKNIISTINKDQRSM